MPPSSEQSQAKGIAEVMKAVDLLPMLKDHLELTYQSYKTRESYLCMVRPFLLSLGPSAVVADITTYAIRKYLTEYAATHAPASACCLYAALHTSVRWLVEEGYLPVDPMSKIKPPKPGQSRQDCLTREEMLALIAATSRIVDPYRMILARTAITTLAYTGIRCSELLGLKVDDVDFRAGTIYLRAVKGGGSETRPIVGEVLTALRELKQARAGIHPTHAFLFALRPSSAMTANTLRGLIREVAVLADFRGEGTEDNLRRFHPHAFRHGLVSVAFQNGASVVDVRDLVGHKNIATTNKYAHSDIRNNREKLSEATALGRKTTAETQRPEAWTERRRRKRPM